MKNFPDIKITNVLTIVMGGFFLIITVMIVLLVNQNMKQQALIEAEAKARILIDRNLATHTYFSHILKPRVFEWTAPLRTPEYFDPSWMSSTYAVRGIHKYFDALNPAGYYIKDAALDARSPENEADEFERAFLDKLKNDRSLESYSEIRTLDGKPYLAVLRRGETMEASCLRCHSTPGNAPKDLLKHYTSDRSFHRNAGDLVSTISLRIPLSAAYEGMYQTFKKLSILLAILLALLFGVQTFLYRRFLVLPIGIIRDKAKELAESDEQLGVQISEPIGKELKELAVAFNEMSLRLRAGRDHLEDRVEARTRELSASNEQLEREIRQRRVAEDELRESEKKYRELSIIDNLTQLYNSRYFYSQLKIEIDRFKRYGEPLTLILLDIDDFKSFNDTYGHVEGDQVLSAFGQVIQRCLRKTDSAYRYGGEEFTVLLPVTRSEAGLITAERIRTEFKKETFSPLPGQGIHLTTSIGIAQYRSDEDMKAFVQRVDQLMYQAKKKGKDRVCSGS